METHFNYASFPNKLNLGCGYDKLEGYLNVDLNSFHQPDLVADVSDLKELPSSYYSEIIAQDILEHIERTKTKNVLFEWNRLLIPNGILKLRIPNLIGLFSLFEKKENQTIEKQEQLIQCCFGTQAYGGDFHYTSFTELLIKNYLFIAGFEITSLTVRDEWLFEIIARKTTLTHSIMNRDNEEISKFLYEAYSKILHRPPDIDGYNYYYNQIYDGKIKKEDVIFMLTNSDEKKRIDETLIQKVHKLKIFRFLE